MAIEIERKFLVDTTQWMPADQGTRMIQAYLSLNPSPTVRIRIAGDQAYLTIKARSETISHPEFEYEIPVADGMELLQLAVSEPVEKTRYEIWHEGLLWVIDVFFGKNKGLVMAEIELDSIDQQFTRPAWLMQEVSGDERFYNSSLSVQPFQDWSDEMA